MAHFLYCHRQQFVVVDGDFHHHLKRVLDGRYTAGSVKVRLLFCLDGVRCVVGCYGVDEVVLEGGPECKTVVVALDGGVALDEVAKLGVVAVVEPEVVRRHLGGDMLLVEIKIR